MDDYQYKKFLNQIEIWNRNEEFEKIIEALTKIPIERRSYELTMLLAGAYVNIEKYTDALEILESAYDEGFDDPEYYFSIGYAHYYSGNCEEAFEAFEKSYELDPNDVETLLFICFCTSESNRDDLFEEYSKKLEDLDRKLYNSYFNPEDIVSETYDIEEIDSVELFIENNLGEYNNVLHEISSTDIACDILLIPPNDEHDYYTLVTCGMGAHKMKIPEELQDNDLERAELILCLPSGWHVKSSGEKWFWPLKLMKTLAHLPIKENSWLGWGHTITNEKPYFDNTQLSGVILANSPLIDEDNICELPSGERINFYQIIPLYEEEMNYKISNNAEALFDLIGEINPVLDINRKNYCSSNHKKYKIPKSTMKNLINCGEVSGCFVTDRIIVDGAKIGFMYRENPFDKQDSGWRFMAGDETEEYMNDTSKSGIYHLNTICNYDEKIIPLLNSPIGSVFRRNSKGELILIKNK